MKNIESEKGSTTLFVLTSIMFFAMLLVALYISSNYKIQKQQREIEQIQKNYETEDIDDIYNRIAITTDTYTFVTTYEELQQKISNENESYIVLANDIITSNYLTISRSVIIDLNGYTYLVDEQTSENSSIIVTGTNTELTIRDSSENEVGCIATKNIVASKNLISIENGAKLILESGAISHDKLSNKDIQIVSISNDSKFIMKGATIIGKIIQDGNLTMTSGKILGDIISREPSNLFIQAGTITGEIIYE